MDGLPAPRYIMSIILSIYQHCDEQQFQTLSSCTLYTIFPVIIIIRYLKLDLFTQALYLLLDYIPALHGKQYAYAIASFYIEINIFEHFKTKHTTKSTSVS